LALEAALLLSWPLGWALAAFALVDRGEARVFATLGHGPRDLSRRLVRQAAGLVVPLLALSFAGGVEARAPGGVVNELVQAARITCANSGAGSVVPVPFVAASWLCGVAPRGGDMRTDIPRDTPRDTSMVSRPLLVGRAPLGGIHFAAEDAHLADDLRSIELREAQFALPAGQLRAKEVTLRGLPAFTRPSTLPAWLRGGVVAFSAWLCAFAAVHLVLRMAPRRWLFAAAVGCAGPIACMVLLRAAESFVVSSGPLSLGAVLRWFAVAATPLLAWGATRLSGALMSYLPTRAAAGRS
jgi:hypothetical protein